MNKEEREGIKMFLEEQSKMLLRINLAVARMKKEIVEAIVALEEDK